jgi:hypothetical protein
VKPRRQILLDCLLLFLGCAILVRPYFTRKYTNQWPSIESTFIADAHFLMGHWPHPQWQPLWYAGTRFDYIYPPALRYGTAIVAKITGYWPVKAYHFYTIFFYCLGTVGAYLLWRAAGRARGAAFLAAAATVMMSPSLIFMKNMRADSGPLVPVRLGALLRYGEGPHITSVSLLPFALAFAWMALDRRRPGWIALAGIFSAAVVSNNFYGATALAMSYSILLWSFWITRGDRRMALPAVAIPLLAYGLTAFWFSPSYAWITARNMRYVSQHGNTGSLWLALMVGIAYLFITRELARSQPDRTWAVFAGGMVLFFSLNVLGNYYFDFRVIGEPGRLIPELDLALIMGVALILEWLWRRASYPLWLARAVRVFVIAITAAAFASASGYIRLAWHITENWPDYTKRVEYRVTDWLWTHMPGARVCTGGTVRFWFDTWHDLAELGGGSEQGLLNMVVEDPQWEIGQGTDPAPALLWLQALGVDAIYFAGPNSEEPYKDYQHSERFAAQPVLYDDGQGNRLIGIPRRYSTRARVVDAARMKAQKAPQDALDVKRLRAYVDVVENGPDSPVKLERQGTDAMLLRARVEPGQAILLQESWDPAWQAWSGGKRLPVRKDIMGFMLVDAAPGSQPIQLAFVTPVENRVGRFLTILTLMILVKLFARRREA